MSDHPAEPPGPPAHEAPNRRSLLAGAAVWTAILTLLWLGLAGQFDLAELVVAVLVSALAAIAGMVARHHAGLRHRPGTAWPRHGPGMVGQAVSDCFVLVGALGRRLGGEDVQGTTLALPCEVGDGSGGHTARRVLITLGTSLQPNSYVLGFDEERQLVIVHQLVETDSPPIAADLRGRS